MFYLHDLTGCSTEMAPYYRLVTSTGALPLDNALLERLEKANKEELEKLDERLSEAQQTEGESDIADALRARANHFTTIGDKVRARPLLCCHCSRSTIVQYLG